MTPKINSSAAVSSRVLGRGEQESTSHEDCTYSLKQEHEVPRTISDAGVVMLAYCNVQANTTLS